MSISLYYNVTRKEPLTEDEKKTIDNFITKYSVNNDIKKYIETGEGLNWESFSIYDTDDSMVILEGATALPSNTDEASWTGMQHWCKLLSEIRRAISNGEWEVRVEDHDIEWNISDRSYDPSK